jgi:SAM-dependent methyltransferase
VSKATFDEFSDSYEEALDRGISVSGEDSLFFARGRLVHLAGVLAERQFAADSVLDFGCGVGNSLPLLRQLLSASHVAGVDISSESIATARKRFPDDGFQLTTCDQLPTAATFKLAFCNGVFHHIPPDKRAASARLVYDHLEPGGLFAFFENNPLNPGTRYVMSRIPFDREAITLLPHQSRRLLRSAGFEIVLTQYLFFFPKALAWFRPLEPAMRRLALGAQYLVLARKPRDSHQDKTERVREPAG